jgi:hypothetical protein
MKKKIYKFLAVGVTLALMVSLVAFASPVSASDLKWGSEDIPDAENEVIRSCNITDLAVNGNIVYAVCGDSTWNNTTGMSTMFRSTDGGWTWKEIRNVSINATFVAVAPDDENLIVIASDGTGLPTPAEVYISDDAGSGWDSLGGIREGTSSTNMSGGSSDIYDLAISPGKSDEYIVAVAGLDNGGDPNVFYYDYGDTFPNWTEAGLDDGFAAVDVVAAVEFSPNYASDEIMVAVSANNSSEVFFEIYSHDSDTWNTEAGFDDYPGVITGDDSWTTLDRASIAMAPTYLGSDDAERICFIGLNVDDDTEVDIDGIYRMDDDSEDQLEDDENIYSIAYDGTNLVAGRADGTTVYRSANPLSTAPTVSTTSSTKSPGGEEMVVVAWVGDDVVAGTTGDESAFAYSTDNGKTFNDISLIDTTLSNITDVAVTLDGSRVYLCSDDGADFSLWSLRDDDKWERILTRSGSGFIARVAPDDADVIYVAEQGDTTIYYSSDAGQDRWQPRTCGVDVQDMAVETDGEVVYVLDQALGGEVVKSENSGFTWGSGEPTELTQGYMIVSLGEDLLIVGGTNGYVSYSTDGNTSWTDLDDQIDAAGGNVQVIASGLADGDYIYAASDATGDSMSNWKLGEDDEWNEMFDDGSDEVGANYAIYGLALNGDDFYALAADTTDNASLLIVSTSADTEDPYWRITGYGSEDEEYAGTPQGLRMSIYEDYVRLWAVETEDGGLESFDDTVILRSPALRSPASGTKIKLNPVSGEAYDVPLSWVCPSDRVEQWDVYVALDEDFDETVLEEEWDEGGDEGDIMTRLVGPGVAGTTFNIALHPGNTYYWKVRVDNSDAGMEQKGIYSDVWSFTIEAAPEAAPPVTIKQEPAPVIEPKVTLPEIKVEVPPPTKVEIPPAPPAPAPITPGWIYAIIAIGAVLVIAVIVLIVRTRRVA